MEFFEILLCFGVEFCSKIVCVSGTPAAPHGSELSSTRFVHESFHMLQIRESQP